MNRKQLAAKMDIDRSTLHRYMKKYLSEEFRKQIKGRMLFENEVKHIYEKITGAEKWILGSK